MTNATMRSIFTDCQKGLQNHGKLIDNLWKIYDGSEFEEFWNEFNHHLLHCLIVLKREVVVERALEFVVKFTTSKATLPKPPVAEQSTSREDLSDEEDDCDLHPLLQQLFEFLLNNHDANDRAVRFRCCMMIKKLLSNMGDDAQLDDTLYDRIYECMLQRMRDKFPIVRVQAVLSMGRLQDPTDQDCPVIAAYVFLMSCDGNSDVRRAVLSSVAASAKTLGPILDRTRDVKDAVRKLAYQVISEKIHIRALTIAQRVRLLQDGLNDRIEIVKDACVSLMLQAWLRSFEGNILELLKCIDVENSIETAEKTLKVLFKKSPTRDLIENFDQLNDQLVIPQEKLTCEVALYWQVLCDHITQLGVESETWLEKLIPTPTAYCSYIRKINDAFRKETDIEAQLSNEFIMERLLNITSFFDLSDEVGRRSLKSLVHDMLICENISHVVVKPLLDLYAKINVDPVGGVNQLVEIISDIREPITVTEDAVTAEEQRKTDLKIASIRVEVNQLRDELDKCVAAQDFGRAAEIKSRISELDAQKNSMLEDAQPKSQEVRLEKTDPITILKCLTIANEMLKDPGVKTLNPCLLTLMETLIVPGVTNSDPAVRNIAVKTLGLTCLLNKATAATHLLLFVQVSQMDQERIQVSALQSIFDILIVFGLDSFQVSVSEEDLNGSSPGQDDEIPASPRSASDSLNASGEDRQQEPDTPANTAGSILTILNRLLDSESSEIRTVCAEGIAKLLLLARVVSPKLLSRLLILWYNPLTEDDNQLRHCLGTFFLIYAFAGRGNMEVVVEAFLPTLRTLMNAPAASPLVEIDLHNTASFLAQLTDVTHLVNKPAEPMDAHPHDTIALKVCNEILSDPNSFNVRVLCKILNMLNVCSKNETAIKDLMVLGHRMIKEVKDKHCVTLLKKFRTLMRTYFRKMCNARGSEPDDNLMRSPDENAEHRRGSVFSMNDNAEAEGAAADVTLQLRDGELENTVFQSPAPVKRVTRVRKPKSVATPKKNLNEILSDSDQETAAKRVTTDSKARKSSRLRKGVDGDERPPLSGIGNATQETAN